MRDGRLGLRGQLAVADPQRRIGALGIKLFAALRSGSASMRRAICLATSRQFVGDRRVAGGKLLVERALVVGALISGSTGAGASLHDGLRQGLRTGSGRERRAGSRCRVTAGGAARRCFAAARRLALSDGGIGPTDCTRSGRSDRDRPA